MDPLTWKKKNGIEQLSSLEDLLELIVHIPEEDIEESMARNKSALAQWIEKNFPREIELLVHLSQTDQTNKQLFEHLARDLRKGTLK